MSAPSVPATIYAETPRQGLGTRFGPIDEQAISTINIETLVHDLNNQLQCAASAVGMLSRRLRSGSPMDFDALAQSARSAIRGAGDIVSRLCEPSRPETTHVGAIDVEDIIHALLPLLRTAVDEDISVTCRTNVHGHPVGCDVHALENAILNLVLNARDAMPGGGRIIVTADIALGTERRSSGPADVHVCIAVRDDGEGMTEEVRRKACEPYVTTKAKGPTRGLGLASVKAFVDASDGWLKIESELGRGCAVLLYLPVVVA